VIDCEPTKIGISKAISILYTNEFIKEVENMRNPYGNGGASKKLQKSFRTTH